MRITYGKSGATSIDDPDFVGVKQIVEHFIEGTRPGVYLVDRFPWLKYVPGYGRRLKMFHDFDLKFYKEQLNRVKYAMVISSCIYKYWNITMNSEDPSHQTVLAHRSPECYWRMALKINLPSMRWPFLREQSSRLDPIRYDDLSMTWNEWNEDA